MGRDKRLAPDDKWELCLTEHIPNFKIGVTADADGIPNELTSGQPCGGSFIAEDDGRGTKKGYITLYVKWSRPAPTPPLPENIHLKIRAKELATTLVTDGSDPNASEVCKPKQCSVNVRHNGKTTLQDVLNGQAVFVADGIASKSTGTAYDTRKFDFVKEMLNQAVPRKRNLHFDAVAAGVKESVQSSYPYRKTMSALPPRRRVRRVREKYNRRQEPNFSGVGDLPQKLRHGQYYF